MSKGLLNATLIHDLRANPGKLSKFLTTLCWDKLTITDCIILLKSFPQTWEHIPKMLGKGVRSDTLCTLITTYKELQGKGELTHTKLREALTYNLNIHPFLTTSSEFNLKYGVLHRYPYNIAQPNAHEIYNSLGLPPIQQDGAHNSQSRKDYAAVPIMRYPELIDYIPHTKSRICIAFACQPTNLKRIDTFDLKTYGLTKAKLIEHTLFNNGRAIKYLKTPTEEQTIAAIRQDGYAIAYIPPKKRTIALQELAITTCRVACQFVTPAGLESPKVRAEYNKYLTTSPDALLSLLKYPATIASKALRLLEIHRVPDSTQTTLNALTKAKRRVLYSHQAHVGVSTAGFTTQDYKYMRDRLQLPLFKTPPELITSEHIDRSIANKELGILCYFPHTMLTTQQLRNISQYEYILLNLQPNFFDEQVVKNQLNMLHHLSPVHIKLLTQLQLSDIVEVCSKNPKASLPMLPQKLLSLLILHTPELILHCNIHYIPRYILKTLQETQPLLLREFLTKHGITDYNYLAEVSTGVEI